MKDTVIPAYDLESGRHMEAREASVWRTLVYQMS